MDLANELLMHIFGYLSYDDLMATKDVNQRFGLLVQTVLRLGVVLIRDTNDEMPIVCRPFGQSEPVRVSDFLVGRSIINFKINDDVHQQLTKLVLYNPRKLFNMIGFERLVSLEIQLKSNTPTTKPIKLVFKLDNLRRFIYVDKTASNLRFIMDAAKLTHLKVNVSLSCFKIMYPRSIEELHCLSNISIEPFVNVRTIHCKHLYYDRDRSLKTLRSLKRFFFYMPHDGVNQVAVLQYFSTSENPALAVYYRSIHFDADPHPLRSDDVLSLSLQRLKDDGLQTYEANLEHLGEHLTQSELELGNLDERSMAIIQRLANLTVLTLNNEVRNEEKFVEILRSPMLSELQLRCMIPQELLDQIPEHCRHLTKLEISYFEDVNFILELHELTSFSTNQFFDFRLLGVILNRMRKLRTIRAHFYVIEITGDRVRCRLDTNSVLYVLDERRDTFVQMIASIDDWTALFKLDDL